MKHLKTFENFEVSDTDTLEMQKSKEYYKTLGLQIKDYEKYKGIIKSAYSGSKQQSEIVSTYRGIIQKTTLKSSDNQKVENPFIKELARIESYRKELIDLQNNKEKSEDDTQMNKDFLANSDETGKKSLANDVKKSQQSVKEKTEKIADIQAKLKKSEDAFKKMIDKTKRDLLSLEKDI